MPALYPHLLPFGQKGFTLVELLVVISIIAIMSVFGMASFKEFSNKQPGIKAQGQVQTLLRLAQSNTSTSTLCPGVGGVSWSIVFNEKNLALACGSNNQMQKIYQLENAEIEEINCGSLPASSLPVTFSYFSGAAILTFLDASNNIITESSCTITIKNLKDTDHDKKLTISKGGTINVEQ